MRKVKLFEKQILKRLFFFKKAFKAADKEFKNKIFTLEKKMVKWENVKIKSENRKKPNQVYMIRKKKKL